MVISQHGAADNLRFANVDCAADSRGPLLQQPAAACLMPACKPSVWSGAPARHARDLATSRLHVAVNQLHDLASFGHVYDFRITRVALPRHAPQPAQSGLMRTRHKSKRQLAAYSRTISRLGRKCSNSARWKSLEEVSEDGFCDRSQQYLPFDFESCGHCPRN
jgi:hypothetical protein